MKRSTKQVLWLVLFGVVLVAPILIMLIAPEPSGRQLWRDVAVGLGFLGFALMGFVFVPGGRLRMMTEVFELDTLYKVHHTLSRAAFFLVLAHPLLLIVQNPNNFVALNLLGAPWKLRAGVIAFALMVLLVMTSIWRQWLRLRYEVWRGLHNLFSIAVVGFALYHIFRVDYYTALPLQRALWVLYAVIWGGIIIYIRIVKPAMLLRSPYELVDVVEERGKTWTLALEPVGHAGMPFKAGQVAWLSVGHSPFRIKEHPFSFSSSAEHPERARDAGAAPVLAEREEFARGARAREHLREELDGRDAVVVPRDRDRGRAEPAHRLRHAERLGLAIAREVADEEEEVVAVGVEEPRVDRVELPVHVAHDADAKHALPLARVG